jgi:hypothetical protein
VNTEKRKKGLLKQSGNESGKRSFFKGRRKGTHDDAFHLEEPFEVKDLETANSCEKDSLYD